MFVVLPTQPFWAAYEPIEGKALTDGFFYASNNNERWLSTSELRDLIEEVAIT
jgi:hypothetical protein